MDSITNMDIMIAQTIQLAIAPVFVLVAIGNIIGTLSSRLGRVVDRWRELKREFNTTTGDEHDEIVRELRLIDQRMDTIGNALRLLVLTALSIGATIVVLFIDEFAHIGLQPIAAGTFIVGVALLMWALVLFLRETQIAREALRIPDNYLERDRKL